MLLLATVGAQARSARDVFVQAPDSVLPLFPSNSRLDMLDYHAYNLPTTVRNRLGGYSRVTDVTPDAVAIQAGDASQIQMALVTAGRDTLVAVVETVLTPQADSHVRFYRLADWSTVAQSNEITMADFVGSNPGSDVEFPPIFFREIKYVPSEGIFVFTNTTRAYYGEADAPSGLALLDASVSARFDGRRWRKVSR